jgi:hypothetical protein
VKRAWAASLGSGNEKPSPVSAVNNTCSHCHRPLIEIDHYGECSSAASIATVGVSREITLSSVHARTCLWHSRRRTCVR